ncbi:MAG: class II aldolase/adducin family protein [Nitrososphaerales archaeon]
MSSVEDLEKQIILGCRIAYNEGIFGRFPFGHLSARHPDGDKFLIPYGLHGGGKHVGEVEPGDIQILDLDGNLVGGAQKHFFDEIFAHCEIYRARRDVMAIAHVHPPVAKAMGTTRTEIYPVFSQAAILSAGIKNYEPDDHNPRLIGTPEDGVLLAKALGDAKAVSIRAMAIDVTGASVADAVCSALILEENAKMQLAAMQAGTPIRVNPVPRPPRPPGSPPSPSAGRNMMWEMLWNFYMKRLMKSEWAITL